MDKKYICIYHGEDVIISFNAVSCELFNGGLLFMTESFEVIEVRLWSVDKMRSYHRENNGAFTECIEYSYEQLEKIAGEVTL